MAKMFGKQKGQNKNLGAQAAPKIKKTATCVLVSTKSFKLNPPFSGENMNCKVALGLVL